MWCSFESSWSPEFSHIRIFKIGPKMTELWAKNVCPYMVAHPIFDYILALKWANTNIFTWDLFYMINMHKVHIIGE